MGYIRKNWEYFFGLKMNTRYSNNTMSNIIFLHKASANATMPLRATPGSAGIDLFAAEDTLITGGCGNVLVKTDIKVHLPLGTYGRIAMRSGLAIREHLAVSAGVIDADYTGNIGVVVYCTKIFSDVSRDDKRSTVGQCYFTAPNTNLGLSPHQYLIKKGERFAQLIVEKISTAQIHEVKEFLCNDDHAGFGSTGSGAC